MLEAGYTSVVEFHYLHHAPDGSPYDPTGAMAGAIVDAARIAGIGLTLVPVLYQTSGFGGLPPTEGQRRFVQSVDALFEMTHQIAAVAPEVNIGLAIHSLRAVPPGALKEVIARVASLGELAPIHIHIAEQTGEVDDCLTWSGQRPVDWLLNHADVDERWCLVHATHVTQQEVTAIAASGAVVALCPSTEGNLGDGFFPLRAYLDARGRIAIGSDSHVSVDPFEELRWLEYGQRMLEQARAIAATPDRPYPGARLYRDALAGGTQAAGGSQGELAIGKRADLLVIDPSHSALLTDADDGLLDAVVFQSGGRRAITRVMAGGAWRVEGGRHVEQRDLAARYRAAIQPLRPHLVS
jgi:formimidoylglutamate deiminase